MGLVQSNSVVNENTQIALNSVTQTSIAKCGATCSNVQSGNVVFVNGSTVGNITFNQTCTVDATCQITNSITAAAQAVQGAIQNGTASPSFLAPPITIDKAKNVTFEEVSDNIYQALDSTCNNGASNVQSNNLVYVYNSTTGDIGFNQNTNVTSQCVLNNLAQGTATSTQKVDQAANAGSSTSLIILAIIIIVIIIVVAIVISIIVKQKKKQDQDDNSNNGNNSNGNNGNNNNSNGNNNTKGQQQQSPPTPIIIPA
jgi:preprotein translocase subunit YajC